MNALVARYWMPAGTRFAKRSARERGLALAIAMALAVVFGDHALLRPMQARLAALQSREQALVAPDPAVAAARQAEQSVAQRRRELTQELAQVDTQLDELTAQLVPAQEMKPLLDRLIAGLPGLRLIGLRNLPPEPVRPAAAAAAPGRAEPAEGQVYRHGFEVTVEGGYAELVEYLERLEAMPQRVYWKRADLDASHYPKERLVFEIYTLSREPTWLIL
jgi:MSHA biogenesis protein MshJ